MTLQFAVIGNPIAHSRSPELHHAFGKACQIDLNYQKILAEPDDFAQVVQDFFAQGGKGMNVTVPCKEQAFSLCKSISPRGQIAQAINTLYLKNGELHGDNTDGQGLVDALKNENQNLTGAKILILGAGGATRGVIYPLAQAGVTQISIANRTLSRAEQLVSDLQTHTPNTQLHALSLEQLNELTEHFDMIINATSASLSGDALQLPESLTFDFAYEMAYGKPSTFLQQAEQRGIKYADGYSMLVGQAIEAFYLWHGVRPKLADFL
ncbi:MULTISPECIES: shikimate dehydrogenase [unclassified Acinetobacter]|uniref:shikimate dehydrogenase n=1 Tax=unclassified Acinetobacter TaxID=196816 RepID=UPI0035B802EF